MLELEFYRCTSCHKPYELEKLTKSINCVCGSRRFSPAYLPLLPFTWYVIKNPGLIVRMVKGK